MPASPYIDTYLYDSHNSWLYVCSEYYTYRIEASMGIPHTFMSVGLPIHITIRLSQYGARRGDIAVSLEPGTGVPSLADVTVRLWHVVMAASCIRESVDSLCRDGADAQYMQYLSKSHITSPQTRKKLI